MDAAKAFRMRRGQKAILNFPLQSEANPKPNNSGRKRRIHQRDRQDKLGVPKSRPNGRVGSCRSLEMQLESSKANTYPYCTKGIQ
ncbi:myosin protein XIF [Trifolium repens]|nr:myosin protein XIF [Trifolium repens]